MHAASRMHAGMQHARGMHAARAREQVGERRPRRKGGLRLGATRAPHQPGGWLVWQVERKAGELGALKAALTKEKEEKLAKLSAAHDKRCEAHARVPCRPHDQRRGGTAPPTALRPRRSGCQRSTRR